MTLNMTFDLYVYLKLQKYPQKWIAHDKFVYKSGITGDSMPTGSKVIFLLAPAAILAAILDISNCSRISTRYPLDVCHRGPKDVESSEKNYISRCRVYLFGDLTVMLQHSCASKRLFSLGVAIEKVYVTFDISTPSRMPVCMNTCVTEIV